MTPQSHRKEVRREMGLDLDLHPVRWSELENAGWLLHNRISLERNYHLFDAIKSLTSPQPAPDSCLPAFWYSDEGLRETYTDAYGDPLTYLLPKDFERLESEYPYNQAVIDFMRNLPPDMPIVLWWN